MSAPYTAILSHVAQRAWDRLPVPVLDAVEAAIDELCRLRLDASNTSQLAGPEKSYRKCVGSYRVVFELNHDREQIHVHDVGDRKNIYKKR